ncbi:MAG: response regulator [Desulfobacterales bacterium]|nr:response regulator [Desulfobacterales bacterium]
MTANRPSAWSREDEPEVMILDLKMPGIDGIEVLRQVKTTRPEIEVIILTGHGSEDDREVCMQLGAFAYLQKPVDIDVLSDTLKRANAKIQERKKTADPDPGRGNPEERPPAGRRKLRMALWAKFKPDFWDRPGGQDWPFKHMFNFRRIWKRAVLLIAGVALVPLVAITLIDYKVTQRAVDIGMSSLQDLPHRLQHLAVGLVFSDRTARGHRLYRAAQLHRRSSQDPQRLERSSPTCRKPLSAVLRTSGLVDGAGRQRTYAGPYELAGVNYSDQAWFMEVVARGVHVSDMFLGYRNVPHIIIAVRGLDGQLLLHPAGGPGHEPDSTT